MRPQSPIAPGKPAVGPRNEAERPLYELIMEGVNSGPSPVTSIDELARELRASINTKRQQRVFQDRSHR